MIANVLDSNEKERQTVGVHQQQHQSIFLVVLQQQSLQPALQNTKPEKAVVPDSVFLELIIRARAALKSWLYGFLTSCLLHLRISKVRRRALVVAIPKPSKPKELSFNLFVSPVRFLKGLSMSTVSNPSLIHCSLLSRLDFSLGNQPWIKQFC